MITQQAPAVDIQYPYNNCYRSNISGAKITAITSFEGINEPEMFQFLFPSGVNYLMATYQAQKNLFNAVKNLDNSSVAGIRPVVIGPSPVKASTARKLEAIDETLANGSVDISNYLNYTNIHPYIAGMPNIPEFQNPGFGGYWAYNIAQKSCLQSANIDSTAPIKPTSSTPTFLNITQNNIATRPLPYPVPYQGVAPYGSLFFNRLCLAKPLSGNTSSDNGIVGDKPVMATETGYRNSHPDPSRNKDPGGISESQAAIYIPRMALFNFNEGITRTFFYEFIDLKPDPNFTDPEHHFGLLRNDGSAKPAFLALKNLLDILTDRTAFNRLCSAPGSLTYSLPNTTALGNRVYQTLMQKCNGHFYLALWLVPKLFIQTTSPYTNHYVLPVMPQTLQLSKLPANMMNAKIYRWQTQGTVNTTQHQIVSGSLELSNVADRLMIVELY